MIRQTRRGVDYSTMNISEALYHGATGLKYALIKESGYMATGPNGYIFCTEDINKAMHHGYARYRP